MKNGAFRHSYAVKASFFYKANGRCLHYSGQHKGAEKRSALLCSALLCSALLCRQCIAADHVLSTPFCKIRKKAFAF